MVRGGLRQGSTRVPPGSHQVLQGLRGGPGGLRQGSTGLPGGSDGFSDGGGTTHCLLAEHLWNLSSVWSLVTLVESLELL